MHGEELARLSAAEGGRECRLCLCDDAQEDLIAPCLCCGSSKWVHRACLDRGRALADNPRAVTHCMCCGFEFRLADECPVVGVAAAPGMAHARVLRDVTGLFAALNVLVVGTGLLLRLLDANEALVDLWGFPQEEDQDHPMGFSNALAHHKLTYYASACVLLLAVCGLLVLFEWLCASRDTRTAHARRFGIDMYYQRPRPCSGCAPARGDADCVRCCLDCCDGCCRGQSSSAGSCNCGGGGGGSADCGGCNHGGGGGGADGLGALLLGIVFVLAFIGLMVALVGVVGVISRVLDRHRQRVHRRFLAHEYPVLDLAGTGIHRDEWSAPPLPVSVSEEMEERSSAARSAPSAPPAAHGSDEAIEFARMPTQNYAASRALQQDMNWLKV